MSDDFARERMRILRAAADKRLVVNDSGRYVILGEQKRPERKARESLMYGDPPMINWPAWSSTVCTITVDGRGELRDLESMLHVAA